MCTDARNKHKKAVGVKGKTKVDSKANGTTEISQQKHKSSTSNDDNEMGNIFSVGLKFSGLNEVAVSDQDLRYYSMKLTCKLEIIVEIRRKSPSFCKGALLKYIQHSQLKTGHNHTIPEVLYKKPVLPTTS